MRRGERGWEAHWRLRLARLGLEWRGALESSRDEEGVVDRIAGWSSGVDSVFLERAGHACRAVGRLEWEKTRDRVAPVHLGTAMLISPRLVAFAALSIPPELGRGSRKPGHHHATTFDLSALRVVFGEGHDSEGRIRPPQRFVLEEHHVVWVEPSLGVVVAAVAETNSEGHAVGDRGYLPLLDDTGAVVPGERISQIHHGEQHAQRIVLRGRRIDRVGGTRYRLKPSIAPDEPGSALFNDQWEWLGLTVGLDDQGRALASRAGALRTGLARELRRQRLQPMWSAEGIDRIEEALDPLVEPWVVGLP
ncbi:hypothetical protein Isop_0490 [Isosphaera pallida ATCC 43644]|uniref:Uncharacterized protein n=1 Tax=Isosphaera pallida (strain ATCC 43644 / DSM 9630 / IS1B) TaxID=575540 RepID=E8QZF8_ISOPI|nr:hypothetical protein [Isosphaera pallida]ADV61085.1 hypothetical protein Isop_0490 [Isosphaera pallida ATCC 43644]